MEMYDRIKTPEIFSGKIEEKLGTSKIVFKPKTEYFKKKIYYFQNMHFDGFAQKKSPDELRFEDYYIIKNGRTCMYDAIETICNILVNGTSKQIKAVFKDNGLTKWCDCLVTLHNKMTNRHYKYKGEADMVVEGLCSVLIRDEKAHKTGEKLLLTGPEIYYIIDTGNKCQNKKLLCQCWEYLKHGLDFMIKVNLVNDMNENDKIVLDMLLTLFEKLGSNDKLKNVISNAFSSDNVWNVIKIINGCDDDDDDVSDNTKLKSFKILKIACIEYILNILIDKNVDQFICLIEKMYENGINGMIDEILNHYHWQQRYSSDETKENHNNSFSNNNNINNININNNGKFASIQIVCQNIISSPKIAKLKPQLVEKLIFAPSIRISDNVDIGKVSAVLTNSFKNEMSNSESKEECKNEIKEKMEQKCKVLAANVIGDHIKTSINAIVAETGDDTIGISDKLKEALKSCRRVADNEELCNILLKKGIINILNTMFIKENWRFCASQDSKNQATIDIATIVMQCAKNSSINSPQIMQLLNQIYSKNGTNIAITSIVCQGFANITKRVQFENDGGTDL